MRSYARTEIGCRKHGPEHQVDQTGRLLPHIACFICSCDAALRLGHGVYQTAALRSQQDIILTGERESKITMMIEHVIHWIQSGRHSVYLEHTADAIGVYGTPLND